MEPLVSGETVLAGKYRLLRPIGRGAFASVYEAEHTQLGRRYAVKVLHGAVRSPRSEQRFEREARLLARLEHENIVSVTDAGEDASSGQFLVLEFIRGSTLRALLPTMNQASTDPLREIVRQLARGLAHAHASNIVHRDLKPENVMLTTHADGRPLVKILDFGIARFFDTEDESITHSGTALGTAAYMAPEQARGERDVDSRADVYALGVITYEVLGGARPFEGDSYNETLFQILTKAHVPLAALRPDLPAALCEVVERALAKDKAARYGDVLDFARDFERALPVETLAAATLDLESDEVARLQRAGHAAPASERVTSPDSRRGASKLGIVAGAAACIAIGVLLGISSQQPQGLTQTTANAAQPNEPAPTLPREMPSVAAIVLSSPSALPSVEPSVAVAPSRATSVVARRVSGVPASVPSARRDRGF